MSAAPGRALAALVLGTAVALAAAAPAGAVEVAEGFETPEQEARYARLLEEYRCLKCQNQSLADSDASLARDLRREIRERVIAEEPKAAIDDYLVARYGEFVLYRPRFRAATALLWIGPFVLLGIGLAVALVLVRRGARAPAAAVDAERLAEARRLLEDEAEERGGAGGRLSS